MVEKVDTGEVEFFMFSRRWRWFGVQKGAGCVNGFVLQLWWNFKTKDFIWSRFMQNKYCRKHHPNETIWKTGAASQVWKKMLQAMDLVEH